MAALFKSKSMPLTSRVIRTLKGAGTPLRGAHALHVMPQVCANMKKLILSIIAVLVLLIVGINGVFFAIWPTSFNDHELVLSEEVLIDLENLKNESKFHPDAGKLYFGSPNDSVRLGAEQSVNLAIGNVLLAVKASPRKSTVLAQLKMSLPTLDSFDSEERDYALTYFERLLTILSISSSNELFNVWRYGVPYGWFIKA